MTTQKTKDQNVFLSRWGFHPVDHETFLKIKRIKKIYWEAVRVYGRYRRWARKNPENQFYRFPKEYGVKRKRSDKPIPEPLCCPLFKYSWRTDCLNDLGINQAFDQARMPKQKPDEVKPLDLSLKEINDMLQRAEKWYAEKN